MAGNLPAKQYICFLLTLTYVVNHQRPPIAAKAINYNTYMGAAIAELPGYNIAGQVSICYLLCCEAFSVSFKKDH